MFDQERYERCFSHIHAPEATLREVLNMTEQRNQDRKKAPLARRVGIAAASLLAAAALSVTVAAAGNGFAPAAEGGDIGSFFQDAFGTGVAGQEAGDRELTDSEGNVVKVEHYPARERIDVDQEQALALVGDSVTDVGQKLTLDGCTLAVDYLVLDENGVGMLTYEVDDANGHGLDENANPTDGTASLQLLLETGDGRPMDCRTYAEASSFSETHAAFVCYFTPFAGFDAGAGLTLTILARRDGEISSFPLELETSKAVSCLSFSGDGAGCRLSPLGLELSCDMDSSWQQGEVIYEDIRIIYQDGSEYQVKGAGAENLSVSSKDSDDKTCWYAFNRLVDAEQVERILISGVCCHGDGGLQEELSFDLRPAR